MAHVKHQKWWGWGEEGVFFNYENKPAFAPFVEEAIGVSLRPRQRDTVEFATAQVPESRAPEDVLAHLREISGAENVSVEDELRVVHWAGKSVLELLQTLRNDFTRVPDVVVYPGSEDEVTRILETAVAEDLVVIPFGGGSSISRSLQAGQDESRCIVSVDMGRLDRVPVSYTHLTLPTTPSV